jgi:exopolyphosphatase/guanosine-5'-triphosphate,3'-diphosphate pyrophosphatase
VRQLEHKESPHAWKKMREWIEEHVKNIPLPIKAIGTGGNISKIYDLANKSTSPFIPWEEIARLKAYIASFSLEDRINKLQLNPDRADVIIPASDIYLCAMKWANATEIVVPDVGLKDGIIQMLYEKHNKRKTN